MSYGYLTSSEGGVTFIDMSSLFWKGDESDINDHWGSLLKTDKLPSSDIRSQVTYGLVILTYRHSTRMEEKFIP